MKSYLEKPGKPGSSLENPLRTNPSQYNWNLSGKILNLNLLACLWLYSCFDDHCLISRNMKVLNINYSFVNENIGVKLTDYLYRNNQILKILCELRIYKLQQQYYELRLCGSGYSGFGTGFRPGDLSSLNYHCRVRIFNIISDEMMRNLTIYLLLVRGSVDLNPGPETRLRSDLTVRTFNCNGLGDLNKLRRVFCKVSDEVKKGGIVLLQETHTKDDSVIERYWK